MATKLHWTVKDLKALLALGIPPTALAARLEKSLHWLRRQLSLDSNARVNIPFTIETAILSAGIGKDPGPLDSERLEVRQEWIEMKKGKYPDIDGRLLRDRRAVPAQIVD